MTALAGFARWWTVSLMLTVLDVADYGAEQWQRRHPRPTVRTVIDWPYEDQD